MIHKNCYILTNYLTIQDYQKLSEIILDHIYLPYTNLLTTIFLCGAKKDNPKSFRYKISEIFSSNFEFWNYKLVYPEDLFEDLMYNNKNTDLLTLENLLADSVDVVILIPESVGSIAELGAFVSNEAIRSKMICLIEQKFKKKKSFIIKGPINLLKKVDSKRVFFFDPSNISAILTELKSQIRKIKKSKINKDKKLNILQLETFILTSVFLLEPVSNEELISLSKNAIKDNNYINSITSASLSILFRKGLIESSAEGFTLTKKGMENFSNSKILKSNIFADSKLDLIRIEIFNNKFRNKKIRV